MKTHGLDLIDVSSGGATPEPPPSWPGFQLPYAQKIKQVKRLQIKGYLTLPEKAVVLDIPWWKLYHRIKTGNYDGDYMQVGKNGNIMFPPKQVFKC